MANKKIQNTAPTQSAAGSRPMGIVNPDIRGTSLKPSAPPVKPVPKPDPAPKQK